MKLTLSLVIPNSMKVNPKKKKERMDIFKANSCAVCTSLCPSSQVPVNTGTLAASRPKPREDSGKVCGL